MRLFNWFKFINNFNKSTDINAESIKSIDINAESIKSTTDIEDTIKSMSVDEYNTYLNQKQKEKFRIAVDKVEKIIDQAYQDYANNCKRNGKYIYDFFYLEKNTYGITEQDIECFQGEGDYKLGVAIKNYRVKYHYYGKFFSYGYGGIPSPDLFVTVRKEY